MEYYWCGAGEVTIVRPHHTSSVTMSAQFVVRNHRYNISLVRNSFVAASSAAAAVQ